MRLQVSAWRRPRDSGDSIKVTEAEFTFVALADDGRLKLDASALRKIDRPCRPKDPILVDGFDCHTLTSLR